MNMHKAETRSTRGEHRWAVYYFEHWSCSKSEFELFPNPVQLITSNEFTTNENEYYGPFNAPLNDLSCFWVLSGCFSFQAYSWLYRLHSYTRRKNLILFIEVKPLLAYDLVSSRKEVDDQIRKRVSQLYGCKYPHPQALWNKCFRHPILCLRV